MFAALASILGANQTIDLTVSPVGADGRMKVIVKPQLVKGSNAALAQPLALVATPQELDAEFVAALTHYAAERTSLQQQVEVTTTIIAEAKKSEIGKATKAIKSGAKQEGKAPVSSPQGGAAGDQVGVDILDGEDADNDETPAPSPPTAAPEPAPAAAPADNDDLLSLL